jgi:nicotinamidase/pyrazinamidase
MEANTKTALIIVDMQNDFCKPAGSLAVEGSLEIIPLINQLRELSEKFDYIVMTRDCHPQNHVSFGSNHPGKDLFSLITVPDTGREQVMWPDHCVNGSFGAEF